GHRGACAAAAARAPVERRRVRADQTGGARVGPVLGSAAPTAGERGVRRKSRRSAPALYFPGRRVPTVIFMEFAVYGENLSKVIRVSSAERSPYVSSRGDGRKGTASGNTDRNWPVIVGRPERLRSSPGGGAALPLHRSTVAWSFLAVAGKPVGTGNSGCPADC